MRTLLAILLCGMASAASANDSLIGIQCDVKIGAQPERWHFSVDTTHNIYTLRVGGNVTKVRQPVSPQYAFGDSPNPTFAGPKFTVNLSPMEMFFFVKFTDGKGYLMPLSGMNPRQVATCKGADFIGL